jgi:hypothetical protein
MAKFEEEEEEYEEDIPCQISPVFTPDGKYRQQDNNILCVLLNSVPDPEDLYVFGPPGSGSVIYSYGSGSGSFH